MSNTIDDRSSANLMAAAEPLLVPPASLSHSGPIAPSPSGPIGRSHDESITSELSGPASIDPLQVVPPSPPPGGPGGPTVPEPAGGVIAELGRIENLTHVARTIELEHDFINPVVIAQPLSFNGAQPAAVRITNVQPDRFTVQVQEPNYLDGAHIGEDLSFLVVEEGRWELPDGTLIEAGALQTSKLTPQGFENVAFGADFEAVPVVLSQVQSKNGADWVVTRQKGLTADGFQVAMQEEEEALNGGAHLTETVGWVAIERGTGTWDGHDFHAGFSGDRVTDQWTPLSFANLIDETPQLLASLARFDGADPAGVRYRGLGPDGVELKVEEEQSADAEVVHTTETVGFLAIEGTGMLVAEPDGQTVA